MAKKPPRLDQLKHQLDRLRRDSLDVVASANKIVYSGVQKLADQELKALNDYYRSAVASIRGAKKDNLKHVAQTQLDLLQNTVNTVIANARASVALVAEARGELSRLARNGDRGVKIADRELKAAVAPAKQAIGKAKTSARQAGKTVQKQVAAARKTVAKDLKQVGKTVKKDVAAVRKEAGKLERQAGATAKKAVGTVRKTVGAARSSLERALPTPSSTSRAGRATSRAKDLATGAAASVATAVENTLAAVKSGTGG